MPSLTRFGAREISNSSAMILQLLARFSAKDPPGKGMEGRCYIYDAVGHPGMALLR